MNWEVSSMRSKRSFFNPTLFWKNLSRSWPLWGSVTAMGALVPLYAMLALANVSVGIQKEEFTSFLYEAVVYFLPGFTFVYAVPVAVFVWNYLHKSRAVGMMHSLAIDRTGLFITNALSGFAMLLIPYVVVGGLLCLLAAGYGAVDAVGVLVTVAAVLLNNILFFGMATLCAMVTGRAVLTAGFYLVLNFAIPVVDGLIGLLASDFIFGYNGTSGELATWFAPLNSLYSHLSVEYTEDVPSIEGFSNLVVYALVGAGMLALSWFLYRIRKSESAGDVVAFPWLRPVFRFGMAIFGGLTLGRVLYSMFWLSIFYDGQNVAVFPVVAWAVAGAVVGYYAASMMLEKTLRVFKGSLKGAGVACAVMAALCLCVAWDVFGIEGYVPGTNEIASVRVSGYEEINCDAEKLPGLVDEIREFHKAIIVDEEHVRAVQNLRYYGDGRTEYHWRPFTIIYTLKNGSQVERYYYLPLSQERTKQPDTYDAKLYAISRSSDVLVAAVTVPEESKFLYGYVEGYSHLVDMDEETYFSFDEKEWEIIYQALLRDAEEGNFVLDMGWMLETEEQLKEGFAYNVYLVVDYQIVNEQSDSYYYYGPYRTLQVDLQPTMKHTLEALVSAGVLPGEVVADWMTATR